MRAYPQYRSLLEAAHAQMAIGRGEPDAARDHLRRALALAVDSPDMPIAAVAGYAVARLRADADPEGAAEVLGAASVLRGSSDAHNPDVAQVAGRLRKALGEHAHRAAVDRGRRLDVAARSPCSTISCAAGRRTRRAARRPPGTPPTTAASSPPDARPARRGAARARRPRRG